MALIAIEGFDNDRLPAGWAASGSNGNTSYTTGRTGGKALRRSSNPYSDQQTISYTLPAPLSELAFGFALFLYDGGYGTANEGPYAGGGAYRIVRLREGTTEHLYLDRDAAGKVRVVRGDGVVLGTSPVATPLWNTWQHIDVRAGIGDGTSGYVTVKINGEPVIELTGVDTRNGGTTGQISNLAWLSVAGGYAAVHLDDFYLTDTTGAAPYNGSLGDCKVETLRPAASGAASGFVGSDGNSVDNWMLVDDNATTSDYVASNTVGARDLYELTNPTGVDLGDVLGVQVEMLAAKSDAGDAPGNLLVAMRADDGTVSTDVVATPAQIATTFLWVAAPPKTVDPSGDPWDVAKLTGLQAGPEIG